MRILFLVESCLRINTSANLCHLAYIQGAVENGCDVDVISVTEQPGAIDESISLPESVNWIFVDPPKYSNSFFSTTGIGNRDNERYKTKSVKDGIHYLLKGIIKRVYGIYGRTPALWLKEASRFECKIPYDYVISLATPFISHRLGMNLLARNRVNSNCFIQIWEDPWTLSLFNDGVDDNSRKEEKILVSAADKVVYVSPLTLKYQQELFPEYKDKMTWHPLPYYYKHEGAVTKTNKPIFGYYGDYFSFSRNLKPFYEAAKVSGIRVNIFGNSDKNLEATENIMVKPRVEFKTLNEAENETSVYVFLCNLKGGQIPGKIYQNSATSKPILFILDGNDYEKKILREYFEQFNRYEFCDNNVDSIIKGINRIVSGESKAVCVPVEEFSPRRTIEHILEDRL